MSAASASVVPACALPAHVGAALASAPALAVTGSRAPSHQMRAALGLVLAAAPSVVLVGCGRGIDAATRAACPGALVQVSAGCAAWQLALRSAALATDALAARALVAAFPSGACPGALVPSPLARRCFTGHGSGTWETLALALGIVCPAVVFLASGIPSPAWLRPVGGRWFAPV